MKYYKFIKITDNHNHLNFCIEITIMRDFRLKVATIITKMRANDGNYKEVYDILKKDYSFCVVHRGWFESFKQAKQMREELLKQYKNKLTDYEPEQRGIIKV